MFGWRRRARVPKFPEVEETTGDRKMLLADQHRKLRRAQALKARSETVAARLDQESRDNHYASRLRKAAQAAINQEGTADAH